jgi:hypothetical protein
VSLQKQIFGLLVCLSSLWKQEIHSSPPKLTTQKLILKGASAVVTPLYLLGKFQGE